MFSSSFELFCTSEFSSLLFGSFVALFDVSLVSFVSVSSVVSVSGSNFLRFRFSGSFLSSISGVALIITGVGVGASVGFSVGLGVEGATVDSDAGRSCAGCFFAYHLALSLQLFQSFQ